MQVFDLVILGGGPAGYIAGKRAGAGGLSVLLIEKRALGGVCLNEGCIPSKSLLYCAKALETAKDSSEYGVTPTAATIDQEFVINRKNKVVSTLVAGIGITMKKNNVTVVEGMGVITGKTDDGFVVDVAGTPYAGRKLLIASGSESILPPIPGAKEGLASSFVLTNREILDLVVVPEQLVVIGGGVIGVEMASYYNSVGSQVTVIEMMDQIGGPIDKDIAKILAKNYAAKGIEFLLGAKVTGIGTSDVTYEKDGGVHKVSASKVLLSVGRKASTAGIGVESIGVHTERGAIVTDEQLRTNISGVYAAGDVNGKSMLAHTASREAEVAVNHILGRPDIMRYHAIPSVIYTTPEVASVGETEESAKEKGFSVKVATMPMTFSGRYLAENTHGDGICKVVMDTKYNRLLGVHLIGSYASEMIFGAAMMVETEMQIDDIKQIVFPHPTVSEIIKDTVFEL